jgi:hypothetical protein
MFVIRADLYLHHRLGKYWAFESVVGGTSGEYGPESPARFRASARSDRASIRGYRGYPGHIISPLSSIEFLLSN